MRTSAAATVSATTVTSRKKPSQPHLTQRPLSYTQDADFATLENRHLACLCVLVCVCLSLGGVSETVQGHAAGEHTSLSYSKSHPNPLHLEQHTHTLAHTDGYLQPVKVRGPCAGMFVLHNDLIVP